MKNDSKQRPDYELGGLFPLWDKDMGKVKKGESHYRLEEYYAVSGKKRQIVRLELCYQRQYSCDEKGCPGRIAFYPEHVASSECCYASDPCYPLWDESKHGKPTLPEFTEAVAFDLSITKQRMKIAGKSEGECITWLKDQIKKYDTSAELSNFYNDCPLCDWYKFLENGGCAACETRCKNLNKHPDSTCYSAYFDGDKGAPILLAEFERVADELNAKPKVKHCKIGANDICHYDNNRKSTCDFSETWEECEHKDIRNVDNCCK